MTTESPVHYSCAKLALTVCPHLKGKDSDLERMPSGYSILRSIVGGTEMENDFGVRINTNVVGNLKIAWRESRVRRVI